MSAGGNYFHILVGHFLGILRCTRNFLNDCVERTLTLFAINLFWQWIPCTAFFWCWNATAHFLRMAFLCFACKWNSHCVPQNEISLEPLQSSFRYVASPLLGFAWFHFRSSYFPLQIYTIFLQKCFGPALWQLQRKMYRTPVGFFKHGAWPLNAYIWAYGSLIINPLFCEKSLIFHFI